ncbi:nucleotidyl transferase AbiEii/AbiGii toxin family protein [[Pasteurella] aerogenes]
METQKPNNNLLTERDKYHEKLMVNILKNLSDTPLVLKGGTALYLGYGLNRFSEDLDFDSSKKLNLLNKIKSSAPQGIVIDNINVKKDTDTVSRYVVNYHIRDTGIKDSLKIEISYRTPTPDEQITIKDGIRFSSVDRIIDNKLNAAYDGENTRTKGRDLFDLHFLATQYAEHFTPDLAERLSNFAQDPDKLVSLYREDIEADPLLNKIMDVEQIALNLNDIANEIWLNKQTELMQNHPAMQAIMTSSQRDFQSLLNSATSTKEEQKQSISSTLKFKP